MSSLLQAGQRIYASAMVSPRRPQFSLPEEAAHGYWPTRKGKSRLPANSLGRGAGRANRPGKTKTRASVAGDARSQQDTLKGLTHVP